MKKERKQRSRRLPVIAAAVGAALCFVLYAATVRAEDLPGKDTAAMTGTLEIRYAADVDGRQPVEGAHFEGVRVAALTEEGTYRLLFDLSETLEAGSVHDGQTLSELEAGQVMETLKGIGRVKDLETIGRFRGTTDQTGLLRAQNLAAGLWLCAETQAAPGYGLSVPLLIPIPAVVGKDGKTMWQEEGEAVVVFPKPVKKQPDPVPAGPRGGSQVKGTGISYQGAGSVVKTGDETRAEFYLAAAVVSLAVIGGLTRRKRRYCRKPAHGAKRVKDGLTSGGVF